MANNLHDITPAVQRLDETWANLADPALDDAKDMAIVPQHVESLPQDDHDDGLYEDKPTEFKEHQLKSSMDRLPLLETLRVFKRAALICSIAAFSASMDGYQYTLSGSIVSNKGFIRQFSGGKASLDPNWVSTFTGIFNTGLVVGQFGMQWMSEWKGRRAAMFTIMGILTIAAIVEAVARQWYVWTIAKFISGIGVGAIQATLPTYINEHAPVQVRGFFTVSYTLWYNVGNLMAAVGLQVQSEVNPYNYLNVIYMQFGMIALSVIIFLCLPESPWWAVSKNKIELARKILLLKNKHVPDFDVERELAIMAHSVEEQRRFTQNAKEGGFFAVFKGLNRKRFFIGCWPLVLQLFAGNSIFSSNATYFFQIAGYPQPFLVNVILTCVALIAIIFDATFIDKIGRRRMCIVGFTGCCVGVLLISIIGLLDYTTKTMGAVLVFAAVFARFFNNLQNSTTYAFLNEVPDQRLKARSAGWGLAYANLYGTMINFTLPLMLSKWGVSCAWFFTCAGIPGTIVAYFIMPETMRRSPAEIQEMFVDHVPLTKWRGYKTAVERDLELRIANHQA